MDDEESSDDSTEAARGADADDDADEEAEEPETSAEYIGCSGAALTPVSPLSDPLSFLPLLPPPRPQQ